MEGLSEIWVSVRLTIELASITTVILLILGTPLAWWLARSKSMWSEAVATIIILPPMLPQPVLGFYPAGLARPDRPGWPARLSLGRAHACVHLRRARYRIGFERARITRYSFDTLRLKDGMDVFAQLKHVSLVSASEAPLQAPEASRSRGDSGQASVACLKLANRRIKISMANLTLTAPNSPRGNPRPSGT